jgi:hypothetical protein
MFDVGNFFPFGLAAILPGSSPSSCSGGVGLGFTRWGRVANLMTVDLFFVPPRARSASPSIATGRLSDQRRLNTSHMEIFLASVTLHGIWAGVIRRKLVIKSNHLLYFISSRCAPLTTSVTQSDIVSEVWNNLLLRHDIFIS